ncbi:MAG: DMT family transporter [Pseudomonadota bacterium]|nr:DMT family transporter [Pseudomonadota bacterium]
MQTISENTRGALLMTLSMAAFTMNDTCFKLVGKSLPLGQVLFLRGVMASLFLLLLARFFGVRWPNLSRKDAMLIAVRSLAEVGAAFFFLTALMNMPLANLTALLQMLPLTVTLGSALFFREAVGWRRWGAIAVGFCGMLLIVKPGAEGFNLFSVYGLIAVAFVTLRDLTVRRISASVPSLFVTIAASVSVTIFAGILGTQEDWLAMGGREWALIGATAAFICVGYFLSVLVMRVGEVSHVAPFRYTGLIWALILGFVVFGDWPGNLTLIGAAIIVATGVFTMWREAQVRRRLRKIQAAGL